jgi:hypothetical protein
MKKIIISLCIVTVGLMFLPTMDSQMLVGSSAVPVMETVEGFALPKEITGLNVLGVALIIIGFYNLRTIKPVGAYELKTNKQFNLKMLVSWFSTAFKKPERGWRNSTTS